MELTLQARNLQRKEAREAWAGIKAIWVLRPRLWRTQSGHQEIAESCPELQREFPEPPLRGFGVVGKIAAGEEVLRLLRRALRRPVSEGCWRSPPGRCGTMMVSVRAVSARICSPDVLPASSRRHEIAEREDLEVRASWGRA